MALMDRVTTLLRANVTDLLDRAEDPDKLLRQFVLDLENQLLQVKTQVAVALANQHVLEKQVHEQEDIVHTWKRKAELAVGRGDDAMARAALERSLEQQQIQNSMESHLGQQKAGAQAWRLLLFQLQARLGETRSRADTLLLGHKRGGPAHSAGQTPSRRSVARGELSPEERFTRLETTQRVEQLLADLKQKQRSFEEPR